MTTKFHCCQESFPTQAKRDTHTVKQHVLCVRIGETIVTRNNGRFNCLVCGKSSKNARTFNIHLKRHRLSGTSIFDSLPPNAENAVPEQIIEDISYFDLDFARPADNNRLVFMDIDISARFHEFQLSVKKSIDSKEHLTLEENVQHILALSSILLLKTGRTHADLHEYISLNTCDALGAHILTSNNIAPHKFPAVTKSKLEQIVEKVTTVVSMNDSSGTRSCSRLNASRQITELLEGDTMNSTNKILLAVRNMVETLPRYAFGEGLQETELITRHLQSSLTPLFEDIDKDVIFRWYMEHCNRREVIGEKQCEKKSMFLKLKKPLPNRLVFYNYSLFSNSALIVVITVG